jgi:hypothetical protein
MDDDKNSLLRYLIEVDTPNYELIDDSCYGSSLRCRTLLPSTEKVCP